MTEFFSRVPSERRALRVADVYMANVRSSPTEIRKAIFASALGEICAAMNDEVERVGLEQKQLPRPVALIAAAQALLSELALDSTQMHGDCYGDCPVCEAEKRLQNAIKTAEKANG